MQKIKDEFAIKSFPIDLDIKSLEDGKAAEFEGWMSINEEPDLVDEIATKGMFSDAFKEGQDKLPLLWNHQLLIPAIGRVEAKEETKGCLISGIILPTSLGKDVAIGVKNKAINNLSYGFYKQSTKKEGKYTRLLKAWPIEASVCNFSIHPSANIIDAKAFMEFQMKSGTWEYTDALYQLPPALKILIEPEKLKEQSLATIKKTYELFQQLATDLKKLHDDKAEGETENKEEINDATIEVVSKRLMEMATSPRY